MQKNTPKGGKAVVWSELDQRLHELVPHLASWLADEEQVIELRFKARDDGTTLAIAKGYAPDGSPIVCFGVGYGVAGAIIGIDVTMQGGRWKIDRPWQPENE